MDALRKKYVFDHVQKTAGNALRSVFESILGRENVSPQPMIDHERACSRFEKYIMIMGHLTLFPGSRLNESRSYLTVLRNPIDRAISHFFYVQQGQSFPQAGHSHFAKTKTIDEFFSSTESLALESFSNFQTNHFMQLEWDGKSSLSEVAKLELAKRALNRFALVGTYEHLKEFIDVFCYEGGHPPIRDIPRRNVTPRRLRQNELEPGLLERLEDLNQADMELWRYATNLFLDRKLRMMTECIEARANGGFHTPPRLPEHSELTQERSIPEQAREIISAPSEPPPADFGTRGIEISQVVIVGELSGTNVVFCGETTTIRTVLRAHQDSDDLTVGITIRDSHGEFIYGTNTVHHMYKIEVSGGGEYYVDYQFRNCLGEGSYKVDVALHRGSTHELECYHWLSEAAHFVVEGKLGHYFEGAIDLQPSIGYGVIHGNPNGLKASEIAPRKLPPVRFTCDTPALTEFRAEMQVLSQVTCMVPSEIVGIQLQITNNSSEVWKSSGFRPVCVSYHWTDEQGNMVEFEGVRTSLPRDIKPSDIFRVFATVRAPAFEGPALLQFALVQERVAWFDGSGLSSQPIRVQIGGREAR